MSINQILERAHLIEQIVQDKYLDEDTDAVDLAFDELWIDASRSDNQIAQVVAMRINQS